MVEQARETVGGDAGGTYAPLTEAELARIERLVELFLGLDQNRSASAEEVLSALGLDYLPRLVAQVRALQRGADAPAAPAERTPEVVLRAMIAVYGTSEAESRILSRRDYTHARRAAHLHACRDELVCELAAVANGYPGPNLSQPGLLEDYEARLSGARPLDAPPPGNRFPGDPPGEGADR